MNKDLVDVLIGEILFDPSGDEEVESSREHALYDFTNLAADSEIQDYDDELHTDRYSINIFNPVQFNLTVEYLTVGVTFQQVRSILCTTKEQTGLALIVSINKVTVC